MSDAAEELEQLIQEMEEIEALAESIQNTNGGLTLSHDPDLPRRTREIYLKWYSRCLRLISPGTSKEQFIDEFRESSRIGSFLANPAQKDGL